MTLVDIMCYVELHTILTLYSKKISAQEHKNTLKWYQELSGDETIQKYNAQFLGICEKWSLL